MLSTFLTFPRDEKRNHRGSMGNAFLRRGDGVLRLEEAQQDRERADARCDCTLWNLRRDDSQRRLYGLGYW